MICNNKFIWFGHTSVSIASKTRQIQIQSDGKQKKRTWDRGRWKQMCSNKRLELIFFFDLAISVGKQFTNCLKIQIDLQYIILCNECDCICPYPLLSMQIVIENHCAAYTLWIQFAWQMAISMKSLITASSWLFSFAFRSTIITFWLLTRDIIIPAMLMRIRGPLSKRYRKSTPFQKDTK